MKLPLNTRVQRASFQPDQLRPLKKLVWRWLLKLDAWYPFPRIPVTQEGFDVACGAVAFVLGVGGVGVMVIMGVIAVRAL